MRAHTQSHAHALSHTNAQIHTRARTVPTATANRTDRSFSTPPRIDLDRRDCFCITNSLNTPREATQMHLHMVGWHPQSPRTKEEQAQ
mmetsp:Transcript_43737/g.69205  ORF Transcript_43737/g.69205 Transcript_43737/m.69205 type:complete len:88 (-) Transcript_43737:869-1132(-)